MTDCEMFCHPVVDGETCPCGRVVRLSPRFQTPVDDVPAIKRLVTAATAGPKTAVRLHRRSHRDVRRVWQGPTNG